MDQPFPSSRCAQATPHPQKLKPLPMAGSAPSSSSLATPVLQNPQCTPKFTPRLHHSHPLQVPLPLPTSLTLLETPPKPLSVLSKCPCATQDPSKLPLPPSITHIPPGHPSHLPPHLRVPQLTCQQEVGFGSPHSAIWTPWIWVRHPSGSSQQVHISYHFRPLSPSPPCCLTLSP